MVGIFTSWRWASTTRQGIVFVFCFLFYFVFSSSIWHNNSKYLNWICWCARLCSKHFTSVSPAALVSYKQDHDVDFLLSIVLCTTEWLSVFFIVFFLLISKWKSVKHAGQWFSVFSVLQRGPSTLYTWKLWVVLRSVTYGSESPSGLRTVDM